MMPHFITLKAVVNDFNSWGTEEPKKNSKSRFALVPLL